MSGSVNSLSNSSAALDTRATSATSDAKAAASGDAAPADADGSGQPDSYVLEQGKLFRSLMAGADSEERRPELLVRGGSVPANQEDDDSSESDDGALGEGLHRSNVDIAAQLLAQRLLEAGPQLQGTPTAAAAPDPTFAELMVKHIRRALVSADAADDSGGEVRLEMSDAVLPGTVLSLRRTEDGWQLSAVTANAESRQALTRFAPTLIERFAQGSLGQLRISLDASTSA
ncbi:MAG TPA: type III secretion HpaP family protein [Steroidobacteraceae bacterium]